MRLSAEGRRAAVFAVLALLLASYAYRVTPTPEVTVEEEAAQRQLLAFDPQAVVQVEVFSEGERLVCQRTPEGWEAEPNRRKIQPGAIVDFIRNLEGLVEVGEVSTGGRGLLEYGLDQPSTRISLGLEGGAAHVLALGLHNPSHTSVYAQVDDTPRVVLVGSVILWEVRKLFLAARS
jgi:hypothetical protein